MPSSFIFSRTSFRIYVLLTHTPVGGVSFRRSPFWVMLKLTHRLPLSSQGSGVKCRLKTTSSPSPTSPASLTVMYGGFFSIFGIVRSHAGGVKCGGFARWAFRIVCAIAASVLVDQHALTFWLYRIPTRHCSWPRQWDSSVGRFRKMASVNLLAG